MNQGHWRNIGLDDGWTPCHVDQSQRVNDPCGLAVGRQEGLLCVGILVPSEQVLAALSSLRSSLDWRHGIPSRWQLTGASFKRNFHLPGTSRCLLFVGGRVTSVRTWSPHSEVFHQSGCHPHACGEQGHMGLSNTLWMDEIPHHLETMKNHSLLVFTGESSLRVQVGGLCRFVDELNPRLLRDASGLERRGSQPIKDEHTKFKARYLA